MEENNNSEEELNNEEEWNAEDPALSKEEILARSRRENKSGDEREQSRRMWSKYAGFAAMVLACAVVLFVRICTEDTVPYDLMAIIFTGLVAQNSVELFVTTNKTLKALSLMATVVGLAAAILYWVEWGMFLAGK